jgi:GNAT superfamily N-acetyltransferase
VSVTDVGDGGLVVRRLGRPGDLGWVVQAHGELYADEFGWDSSFEALVARIVADYANGHDEAREAAWIAEWDGERVGCVFCVRGDDELAVLRILLVHPKGRGRGVGNGLVSTCLDFARDAGYRRITLWTNDVLTSARRIYEHHGFELVEQENNHSFGHDLVGQHWAREL